jgi:hypothetical protein
MTASRNGGISSLQFDSFAKQIETTFRDQFEQFWKSREADTDAQVNRASETASRFLGSEIKLELGQSAPIEVTRLSDTEITSVWMTQASAKVQGKTISSRQVQTSTVILVKGRVLVLFGYQRYKDAADVESLKQLTAQWVKGITELNR